MSIISTTKMTAQQFLQLGEDPPGVRLELVNGEVAVSPSPIPEHSHVIVKLIGLFDRYNEIHDVGVFFTDVDTVLKRFTVRRPDILFFYHERTRLVGKKAMNGPPDLAIEVLSPGSVTIDRVDKFAEYCKAGIVHYWIVDPAERTMQGWKLESGEYVPTGTAQGASMVRLPPFPDLDIPLQKLWWK